MPDIQQQQVLQQLPKKTGIDYFKRIRNVEDSIKRVMDMTKYNATKDHAQNVPEYWAKEIIDLIELMSHDMNDNRIIAKKIIDNEELPQGTAILLKKYFNLMY